MAPSRVPRAGAKMLLVFARRYYDQLRQRRKTHRQALHQIANRWVGILHACLERGCEYDETAA